MICSHTGNDQLISNGSTHKADEVIIAYEKSVEDIFTNRLDSNDKRIRIAILDTGVDCEHPYIATNWAPGEAANNYGKFYKDFTANPAVDTKPRDECGHGTHVAGIILRLAPYAELYVARIFRNEDLREDSNNDTETTICKVSYLYLIGNLFCLLLPGH